MNMKKTLKLSVAVMLLSASTLASIQAAATSSSEPTVTSTRTTKSMKSGDEILRLSDQGPDSASYSISNAAKAGRRAGNPHRLLSIDGGGIRGLIEITTLSVLEELLNINTRKGVTSSTVSEWVRIADVFDAVAGTSTGSILACGLFSPVGYGSELGEGKGFTAVDLIKIYARFGYKIFDEQKRMIGGIRGAKYDRAGLDALLNTYFGDVRLNQFEKPAYVVVTDFNSRSPVVFKQKHDVPARFAAGASGSAPTFFAGVPYTRKGVDTILVDGGLVANDPARILYDGERKREASESNYELYTFGTGLEAKDRTDVADRGFAVAPRIIGSLFDNQTSQIEKGLVKEVMDHDSKLSYMARINVNLEAGHAGMDDTSASFVNYLIKKGLEATNGDVFMDMIRHLGLTDITVMDIKNAQKTVLGKLHALSSVNYEELMPLEREFIEKKILELDFSFYQNMTLRGQTMTASETVTFQTGLVAYYKTGLGKTSPNQKAILANLEIGFTSNQVFMMMQTEGKISPLSTESFSGISYDQAKVIFDGYTSYVEKCKGTVADDIFVKHLLKNIEGDLTAENIEGIHSALEKHIKQYATDELSWTRLGAYFGRGSYLKYLLKALNRYKRTFLKHDIYYKMQGQFGGYVDESIPEESIVSDLLQDNDSDD